MTSDPPPVPRVGLYTDYNGAPYELVGEIDPEAPFTVPAGFHWLVCISPGQFSQFLVGDEDLPERTYDHAPQPFDPWTLAEMIDGED